MSATTPSTIEPWLREILRCPVTHSELVDATGPEGGAELLTVAADEQGHKRAYRVENGIPVLIPEEARIIEV